MKTIFPDKEGIKEIQEQKLKQLLRYLSANSKYYKWLFEEYSIDIHGIKSINDLARIPVTTKEQMQERNMDFLCVDPKDIIEYTATSGTLGKPVTIALTENDLDRLTYNEWLSFKSIGA